MQRSTTFARRPIADWAVRPFRSCGAPRAAIRHTAVRSGPLSQCCDSRPMRLSPGLIISRDVPRWTCGRPWNHPGSRIPAVPGFARRTGIAGTDLRPAQILMNEQNSPKPVGWCGKTTTRTLPGGSVLSAGVLCQPKLRQTTAPDLRCLRSSGKALRRPAPAGTALTVLQARWQCHTPTDAGQTGR